MNVEHYCVCIRVTGWGVCVFSPLEIWVFKTWKHSECYSMQYKKMQWRRRLLAESRFLQTSGVTCYVNNYFLLHWFHDGFWWWAVAAVECYVGIDQSCRHAENMEKQTHGMFSFTGNDFRLLATGSTSHFMLTRLLSANELMIWVRWVK